MSNAHRKNWVPHKLNELGYVGRGRSRHRPRNAPELYGGIYPFIQTGDVKATELYISEYSQTYNEKGLAQSKLWEPGTLLITISANIAETAILKIKACFPDSIVGFIAEPTKSDVKFVKYYIDILKLQMQNISRGTTQDNLSLDKLITFDFLTPPLPTQRKIASILSAYDDLIENNTRRIKILEGMAQSLYKEWFVKFRFPGYEQVEMVESALGLIPEGWEVKNLDNIVSEIIDYRGKTPKKLGGDWVQSGIMALSALNVKNGNLINLEKSKFISEELYKKWMKSELMQGDILMTSEAPLGELYYLTKKNKFCLSQRLFSIRANPKSIKSAILYFALSSPLIQGEIIARQSGTTVSGIRQSELRRVPLIVPPMSLQAHAAQILENLLQTVDVLQVKNKNLRQTRDLLLPKLISGEIDVEKLDIATTEIAA